jgi:hypothetical protein
MYAIIFPMILCGCNGTKEIGSSKSLDYTKIPGNIIGTQIGGPAIDAAFKTDLSAILGKCGTNLQFPTVVTKDSVKTSQADALLLIKEVGRTTATELRNGVPTGNSYPSKIRYEFDLTEVASGKIVWKAQDDFGLWSPDALGINKAIHDNPASDWAAAVAAQMQKDGLLAACDLRKTSS